MNYGFPVEYSVNELWNTLPDSSTMMLEQSRINDELRSTYAVVNVNQVNKFL